MSRRSIFIINFYSVARLLCQMVNTPTVLYSTVLYTLVSGAPRCLAVGRVFCLSGGGGGQYPLLYFTLLYVQCTG